MAADNKTANEIQEIKGTDISGRIQWVDLAKGIAILLVIIGHTEGIPHVIRGIIYSFHMPLFFILSGCTSNCSDTKERLLSRLKKTAKGLILPAYLLWLVILLFPYVTSRYQYSFLQIALSAIFTSGTEVHLSKITVPPFGIVWFFVVLFIVRNLYDFINYITKGRFMTFISIAVSVIGVIVGMKFKLPFAVDDAMAAIVFYHFGQLVRKKDISPSVFKIIITFLIWIVIFFIVYLTKHSYFDFGSRFYPAAPMVFIAAAAGSLACMYLCMYLCKIRANKLKFIIDQLSFIGRNSIILCSVHYLDTIWFLYVWTPAGVYFALLIRLYVNIGLFYIVKYLLNKKRIRKENIEKE